MNKPILLGLVCLVLVGVILKASDGFATNDAVETEPKEVPEPGEPTPTPPVVLNNETIMKVKEFLAEKFNKSVGEIEIQGAKETEYMLIVYTNVDSVSVRNGTVYETGLRLNPKIYGTEAFEILKNELLKRNITNNLTVFYNWGGKMNELRKLYYEFSEFDHNYHPTNYTDTFYFLKNLDEEKAVYEWWEIRLDSNTGEIYKLEKTGEATFYNIKTHEDAAKTIEEKMNISVDASKVILFGGVWLYDIDPTNTRLYVYDDGTIKEQEKDVPLSEGSSTLIDRVVKKSKSPFTLQATIGFLLILVAIGGYFVLKRRGVSE